MLKTSNVTTGTFPIKRPSTNIIPHTKLYIQKLKLHANEQPDLVTPKVLQILICQQIQPSDRGSHDPSHEGEFVFRFRSPGVLVASMVPQLNSPALQRYHMHGT